MITRAASAVMAETPDADETLEELLSSFESVESGSDDSARPTGAGEEGTLDVEALKLSLAELKLMSPIDLPED